MTFIRKSALLRALLTSILFIVGTIGITNLANADVREVFVCELLDGSDMDDVMAARDFYIKQAAKAGYEIPEAFLWTPFKSFSEIDFLWFNNYAGMAEFGALSDQFAASADMTAVIDRFNQISECRSGLSTRELIFDGGDPPVPNPPALIHSSGCNLRDGWRTDDLADLVRHINGVLGEIGGYEDYLLYRTDPVTPGQNTPDVRFYSVHDSVAAWGERREALEGAAGGQQLLRHFNAVLDCTTSLWNGQQVVPAE